MPPKPLILALDTAAAHCAAVVVQGNKTLAERVEPMAKGQAERLFPLIEDVLADADVSWDALSAIAVGTGPGNFTGIRISVSAARGLSLSLGIPAIGVSRLDAMAFGTQGPSTALIDARQNRLYVQNFLDDRATSEVSIADIDTFTPQHPTLCNGDVAVQARLISTQTMLENAAHIAASGLGKTHPKPAPLYARTPDAAWPSDPPPNLLP